MFKLDPWGPKRLRDIQKALVDQINAITPVAGLGIDIDYSKGAQISTQTAPPGDAGRLGGSGGGGGSAAGGNFAFQLVADGGQLQIVDGKINGEFPSGMGYGNYILNVTGYSDIYAVVTYDPETLEITSRSLGIGSVPSSEFGTLIIYIGFAYFDGSALKCRNAHMGDINFRLVYGALNGEPALLPVQTFGDWIALP